LYIYRLANGFYFDFLVSTRSRVYDVTSVTFLP